MIAHLSGNLLEKSIGVIIVDVGGVGYEVHIPISSFYSLPDEGDKLNILIYTHVKEDSLRLFGFLTPREKELFIKLIGVSGVGPKLALNILSGLETNDLIGAIASGDLARMNSIPGVGKKTAERLILELRDKMKFEPALHEKDNMVASIDGAIFDDVLSALLNLGYKKGDIEKTLDSVRREQLDRSWAFESLLREALKVMAK